ncbi:hypothetical protein [Halarcobacter bivalviorum]|uniref:Uncharacterized protein n=1 Tax=Halarcobacter bivalviorum TaxID=663364 RepID=A0AAX2AAW9_9BACT|nr:hypothetical protein [Halarcobacter bivalviorum]AXH12485.1 hypothetical protein ABIV_1491 [Halarcobacter bivalviorum]RXK10591.1 hypothetical protein CRV05_04740 [Halarcobacter bivalviorum]
MHEKQLRVRYIRVLEKFFTRTVSLLKLENFDKDLFKERTLKNYEDIKRVKAVDLNSQYLTNLIAFINKTLQSLQSTTDEDFENVRTTLLKEANLLQKEKKRSTYKKDKHKNSKFDDGY